MGVKLFDFQKAAVIKALKLHFMLLCVRVGGGKTLISIFYIKNLFKRKMIDKVVFACTVSAAVAVRGEFEEKFGIDLPQYEKVEDFLNWLRGPEKVCVIKHSMFEKLGYDQAVINEIREICEQPNKRCAIVIDEVHKLGNPQSIAHTAFMNIKFMFERILVMTATPFNSGLLTTYGIISLVNPTLWKNVTAFKKMFITEQTILVNGKVARKEIVEYKNLNVLREMIKPFTFFHYPKIKLNFFQHNVVLKDYTEYDNICKGVLTEKELEKLEGKK